MDANDRAVQAFSEKPNNHAVMLLRSRCMTLDVTVKVTDYKFDGFTGDDLAGSDEFFLGLNLRKEIYGLGFFEKYLRAGEYIVRFSVGRPPANPITF